MIVPVAQRPTIYSEANDPRLEPGYQLPPRRKRMVPDEGIEPPTCGLQGRCSTTELNRLIPGHFVPETEIKSMPEKKWVGAPAAGAASDPPPAPAPTHTRPRSP